MKRGIFLSDNPTLLASIYTKEKIAEIKTLIDLYDKIITPNTLDEKKDITKNCQFIFSTWGMPSLTEAEIKLFFPKLEVIFYAAGSVQGFARPFLNQGIKVTSAYYANAIPTAEYATSLIILANKGFFRSLLNKNHHYQKAKDISYKYPGNYMTKVGILGAGAVGKTVINFLKKLNVNIDIYVFDPFLADDEAKKLGIKKTSLEEIFSTCLTISNHLVNNQATQKIINKNHFALMLPYATFINTGRGQQVDEEALIEALINDPTKTTVLDVTYPEPPQPNSKLYTLENVFLTPHIAGSNGNEVYRMVDFMIAECRRYLSGQKLQYEITLEQLKTMA